MNQGTIKLSNPIMVEGDEVAELDYDFDKITPEMFMAADVAVADVALRNEKAKATTPELDASLHLQLGFQAVIACHPTWDAADLARVRGVDIMRVVAVGRNFTMASAVEAADAGSSVESAGSDAEGSLE